ncbi:MAG: ATP-binding protein [Thermodesulfobacteriota bacterium]
MTVTNHSLSFSIPARLEDVHLIGRSINPIIDRLGFDRVGSYHVELSLVEAANNIITHAYQGQNDQWIEFSLKVTGAELICTFIDQGASYNYFEDIDMSVRKTTDISNLAHDRLGGTIICTVMDQVFFETREGANHTTLIKQLPDKNDGD